MDVPLSLRRWFLVHFVVDVVVGVPLFVAPGRILPLFGWTAFDAASARLVAAALLAIGTQSFFARNAGLETFKTLLNLKLLWSYAAIVGLVLSIGEGAPPAVWGPLSAFIAFSGVWTHYRIRIKQLESAPADQIDDSSDAPA